MDLVEGMEKYYCSAHCNMVMLYVHQLAGIGRHFSEEEVKLIEYLKKS